MTIPSKCRSPHQQWLHHSNGCLISHQKWPHHQSQRCYYPLKTFHHSNGCYPMAVISNDPTIKMGCYPIKKDTTIKMSAILSKWLYSKWLLSHQKWPRHQMDLIHQKWPHYEKRAVISLKVTPPWKWLLYPDYVQNHEITGIYGVYIFLADYPCAKLLLQSIRTSVTFHYIFTCNIVP